MSTRKTEKKTTTSRKSIRKEITSTSNYGKTIMRDTKPLLDGLHEPTLSTYKLAHDHISKLVLENPAKKKFTGLEQLIFLLSTQLSVKSLGGFATLDQKLVKQIHSFIDTIDKYINDTSQQRPLNFMMLASPGAGKSHFIKCVASSLSSQNISAITYNMANMQSNDDLIPSIDAARNLKVQGKLPLLFLDEFDSNPSTNYSLLLPLMWDGGLNLGQRDLRLGKIIIVLAGSDPKLPKTMDFAKSMRKDTSATSIENPKLVDLFSRVNGGVIKIPAFYDLSKNTDRRVDKICISIQLLRQRFGKKLKKVPLGLIKFIADVEFRYDVRSIAHLIQLIPYKKNITELTFRHITLPLRTAAQLKDSSLIYHLFHEDQALGMVKKWNDSISSNSSLTIDIEIIDLIERLRDFPIDFRQKYILDIVAELEK